MSENTHSPEIETQKKSSVFKPVLIGAAAAVGVLLIGAAGLGIGLAVADGNDNDRSDSEQVAAFSRDAERDESEHGDRSNNSDSSNNPSGLALAASDAASLAKAIDAAVVAASGQGATSIDVEPGGWSVEVMLGGGVEVEAFVATDFTATLRDTETDAVSEPKIDVAQLPQILESALAAAGGGAVESVSSEDEHAVRYEVTVNLGSKGIAVDVGEDFAVLSVERD